MTYRFLVTLSVPCDLIGSNGPNGPGPGAQARTGAPLAFERQHFQKRVLDFCDMSQFDFYLLCMLWGSKWFQLYQNSVFPTREASRPTEWGVLGTEPPVKILVLLICGTQHAQKVNKHKFEAPASAATGKQSRKLEVSAHNMGAFAFRFGPIWTHMGQK